MGERRFDAKSAVRTRAYVNHRLMDGAHSCTEDEDRVATVEAGYATHYRRERPRILERRARQRALRSGAVAAELDYITIYRRDKGTCYLCGQNVALEVASWDHVVPLAFGGPHIASNLRVAHLLCNTQKSVRDIDDLADD